MSAMRSSVAFFNARGSALRRVFSHECLGRAEDSQASEAMHIRPTCGRSPRKHVTQ